MDYEKFLPSRNLTAETIINATAKLWGTNSNDLILSRKHSETFARHVAMYLCYNLTSLSLTKVGELFGGKHYTTVLNSIKRVNDSKERSKQMKTAISELEKHLTGCNQAIE